MGTIVLLPGGFKPPHAGHLQLARAFASNPKVDEVRMLIGPSVRDGITREQSMAALKVLLANDPKINVVAVDSDSPMVAAYETLMELPPNDKGTYALAASSKGEDYARIQQFAKSIEQYKTKKTKDGKSVPKGVNVDTSLKVNVSPLIYNNRTDDNNGKGISASVMRKDLLNGDRDNFATNYPGLNKTITDKLYNMFSKTVKAPEKKVKKSKPKNKMKENRISLVGILLETFKLILEGGAGGHMAHPFDIPKVKTGKDLIDVFNDSIQSLQKNPASVKLDGVNASVRIADIGGKKQFVLDRVSNKPLDVRGITAADLGDRFQQKPGSESPHGMIAIGTTVLSIFNNSISKIKPQLIKLGLWDNPNIMLNVEYVEKGTTNVQKSDINLLAIHGLLKIVEKVSKTGSKSRATQETPYDKSTLDALIKNMGPIAAQKDFEMFGSIPAKIKKRPNIESELSKSYTVKYNKDKQESKTLQNWLNTINIPKDQKVVLSDGKTIDAISKKVFVSIKDGTPLDQLLKNPKDYDKAIAGFVTYLATMQLGDAVLKAVDTPLGKGDDSEGVVIRDVNIYDKPFKITGSFILRGLASSF
jgi:hypothetical protein